MATDDGDRLRDEIEQLRTALESSLEENSRLAEDRDLLRSRVTVLARELHFAGTPHPPVPAPPPAMIDMERELRHSHTEEELRVAFEELQVMTEELEVANTSLQQTNSALEARVAERTQELWRTSDALRISELAFRTLVEGMPQLAWRSHGEGHWTWSSPQWAAYTGQPAEEGLGRGWLAMFHPDDRDAVIAAWRAAEGTNLFQCEGRIFHVSEQRYRHFQSRGAPVRDADGSIIEWLGTSTDVDALLQLQQRQEVLVAELQHRTRNLMAVVQTVVARTIKSSNSLEHFAERVSRRLDALARTQGLLSRRGEGKVMFGDLLHEELAAHVELDGEGNGAQVTTSGPRAVPMPSSTVQTLALGLHELATNATKYGALASPGGRLAVRWTIVEGGDGNRLRIDWRESGVADLPAPGDPPRGGGYGRELIERALPYRLGARTSFAFTADGLQCTIEIATSPEAGAASDQGPARVSAGAVP